MAWTLVTGQVAGQTNGATGASFSVTLPNNPTQGNLVVAACILYANDANTPSFTCTDGNSNSFTASAGNPGNLGAQIFHGWSAIFYLIAPANANKTVTIAWTVSTTAPANAFTSWAAEFNGGVLTSPFERDVVNTGGANSTAM